MVGINEIVKTVDISHTRPDNLTVQEFSEDLQGSGVRLIEGPLVVPAGLVDVEGEEGGETGGESGQDPQSVSVGQERTGERHQAAARDQAGSQGETGGVEA